MWWKFLINQRTRDWARVALLGCKCLVQTQKMKLSCLSDKCCYNWIIIYMILPSSLKKKKKKNLKNGFTFLMWNERKNTSPKLPHPDKDLNVGFCFVSMWNSSRDSKTEVCTFAVFLFLIPVLLQNLQLFLYATTLVFMAGWLCTLASLDLTLMTDSVPCGFLFRPF